MIRDDGKMKMRMKTKPMVVVVVVDDLVIFLSALIFPLTQPFPLVNGSDISSVDRFSGHYLEVVNT